MIGLATSLKAKNIQNLDLESDFMMREKTDEDDTRVIPNIIKHFLEMHAEMDNVDNQVFVGNTSKNGSHWLAFSLEKKQGRLFIKLVDSLGQNRKETFKWWFPTR